MKWKTLLLAIALCIPSSIVLVEQFGIWGADCGDNRWNESGTCYISVCHKSYPAILPRLLTGTLKMISGQIILRVYQKDGSHLFSSSYLPFDGLCELYEPARWYPDRDHLMQWNGPVGVELWSSRSCEGPVVHSK